MRILELCLSSSLGGLELYFHRCCQYLATSEHFLLAVVARDTRLSTLAKQDTIRHSSLAPPRWFNLITQVNTLVSLIYQHQIDVLHVHHKADLLLATLSKRFSSRPFKVVHTRQMTLHHSKKDLYHRFLYRPIDLFIAITNQVQQQIRNNLAVDPDQVVRLYYGVSVSPSFPPATRQTSSEVQIGVFGRIERMKGQHLVVEALYQLQPHSILFQCYFYGDVSDQNYSDRLRQTIQDYNLTSQVHFMGFHPEATSLMSGMDMVLMPSLHETFGLTLIEAMMNEVAVIGTDYGGIPEIIDHGKTGLLFERENSQQLADCILKLAKDPVLRQQLAQSGKKKAEQNFQAADHFPQLVQLMADTIKR
ncbi:MAG: glycosyltransferase family 4 protein [Bacteroidota bacterium]